MRWLDRPWFDVDWSKVHGLDAHGWDAHWPNHRWPNPRWLNQRWRRRSLLRVGLGLGLGLSSAIARASRAGAEAPRSPGRPSLESAALPPASTLAIALDQGQQYYAAGRYGAAIALWEPLSRSSHLSSAQRTVVQIYLARAWQALGRRDQAQRWQEQAAQQLSTLTPGPEQRAIAARWLGFQGQLAFDQGDLTQALSAFTTARDHYRDLADPSGWIGSTLNMALVLQALGAERRSLALLREVETQLTPTMPPPLQYRARYALANILQHLGHLTDAETRLTALVSELTDSAASAATPPDLPLRSHVILNLAHIAAERAQLARQSPLPWNHRLVSVPLTPNRCPHPTPHTRQLIAAQAPRLEQQQREALAQCDRWLAQVKAPEADLMALMIAVEFQRETAPALASAWADRPLPKVATAVGRWAIAHELAGVQAVLATTPPLVPVATVIARLEALYDLVADRADPPQPPGGADPWMIASLLGWIGRCAQYQQQWDRAAHLTQRAIAMLEPFSVAEWSFPWLWQLGQITQAQAAAAQPAAPDGQAPPEAEAGTSDRLRAIYAAAGLAVDQIRDHLLGIDPISPHLDIDRHREFLDQIEPFYHDWIRVLLANQRDWRRAREVAQSLRVKEVSNFLQCRLDQPNPQDLSQIAAMSQDRTAVLAVLLSPNQIDVLLDLPDAPDWYRATTPVDSLTLQCTLLNLIQSLKDISAAIATRQAGQAFYKWLVEPVRSRLDAAGVETLVFALDGALRNIPPAVLHDGDRYLIESFAIAIAPDLTLPISQQPHPDPRNATTLIAGLSEPSQGLPSLPYVEQQVQTLQALLPSRVLLNQDFTVARFQEELATRPYRIVHLATHGEYGSRRQDTFLLASDAHITADDLSAALRQRTSTRPEAIDLLVLGACETAEGDQRAWLGLSGLAIRAGARSTLATLWKVSADDAPGDLFAQFYQTWLHQGQSKAKALQAAQRAFLAAAPNSRSRPHLWAVYVLVGDWR